jgi:16S rRNA (cytosine967-C5)-methyltransferase
MRYILQHIRTIIETYDGRLPLAHFLKNYFRQHPILGSRDRKILSSMAYYYYRGSKGIGDDSLLMELMTQWLGDNRLPLTPLAELLQDASSTVPFNPDLLFPHDLIFSDGISKTEWLQSMLVQPDLFIRIRKDAGKLLSLLNNQRIPYTFITEHCLSLPNGAKIDKILPEDAYVVQDASSQQTGTFFNPKKNELWYDCCSGAGGKSLLLKDIEPGVRLTISDRRESIIYNLQQRFKLYRHTLPVAHVTDVADKGQLEKAVGTKLFDSIICDAPCSGSGTWARTPEQLYFFDAASIDKFSALQKKIAINVSGHLKPGGRLIYITCSVFRNENENVVEEIIKETGLKLLQQHLINGISIRADSMFVAIMQKPIQ